MSLEKFDGVTAQQVVELEEFALSEECQLVLNRPSGPICCNTKIKRSENQPKESVISIRDVHSSKQDTLPLSFSLTIVVKEKHWITDNMVALDANADDIAHGWRRVKVNREIKDKVYDILERYPRKN